MKIKVKENKASEEMTIDEIYEYIFTNRYLDEDSVDTFELSVKDIVYLGNKLYYGIKDDDNERVPDIHHAGWPKNNHCSKNNHIDLYKLQINKI